MLLSSVLNISATVATYLFAFTTADDFRVSQDFHINYTTVTGYFLQDLPTTNATTFNFQTTNFGLLNRTYPSDPVYDPQGKKTQWQRFAHQVTQLSRDAPHGTFYKLLYMGRHGEGYHNAAESYYGTPAWNCYYSEQDGNSTVTWADAHLTPNGVAQALSNNAFWAAEIETQKIPTPRSYYTSPLTRCLATANLTFTGLNLPKKFPFVPEVKELFREGISGHTCDRRSSKSYIKQSFPTYQIEPGFSENDELWEALHGETQLDQDIRSKTVLDQVFSTDDNTYVSITSHSGEIASILRGGSRSFPTLQKVFEPPLIELNAVLGHRTFSLTTGAVIPVLVRAQRLSGKEPPNSTQPYTALCTCTSPPAKTATSSSCSYPTATP